MGAFKELMAQTLDRLELLGRTTGVANDTDDRLADVFLTDVELWAIAYVHAPEIFLTASLHADDEVTVPGFETLLTEIRDAYHGGRNNGD